MSDIAKIVFPTDFSELSLIALPWVRRMAVILEAEVHCIYAVEEPHVYATLDMGPAPMPSIEEFSASAKMRMKAFVDEHLGAFDRKPVGEILIGRPADEIIRYAGNIDAEMIIMTTTSSTRAKASACFLLKSPGQPAMRLTFCAGF